MPEPVGIDFGTSTCKMVRYVDGELQHVRIGGPAGHVLVPSVVRFSPEERKIVVGSEAEAQAMRQRQYTYPSVVPGHKPIKTSLTDPEFAAMEFEGRSYTAQDIAEEMFVYLVEGAKEALAYRPSEAIVTVPAYFAQQQIKLIREAAENAGIYVSQMVAEPVAAAIAHSWPGRLEGNILIYDFGGGTFDTTVLRVSGSSFEVFAKLGNPDLGGYLLSRVIYDRFFRQQAEAATGFYLGLETEDTHPEGNDGVNKQRLFNAAEGAKIALSDVKEHRERVELWTENDERIEAEFPVTRDELEDTVRHLIRGTIESVSDVIAEAGLTLDDVDHILMVGGVTRMPIIRNSLRELAGEDKVRVPADPDMLVAEGAALLASEQTALDVTVRDVLARALRMRVPKTAHTHVIIPSGSPLDDASNTLSFRWPGPNTRETQIDLCEGDAEGYAENQPIGAVVLRPEQPLPARTLVDVAFRFDPAQNTFVPSAKLRDGGGPGIEATLETERKTEVAAAGMDIEHVARADIVLCIDVSGSFRRGPLPLVRSLCLRLEQALQKADIRYRFGVVAFGDSQVPGELTVAHPFSRLERALQRRLDSLPQYDGGDMPEDVAGALQRAVAVLASSAPHTERAVLLFTDAPPKEEDAVSALAGRLSTLGARIHIFGPTVPYVEVYRELAEAAGGEYVDVHEELFDGSARVTAALTGR